MITMSTQPTWGIGGPEFLWLYGTLCVGAAVGLWLWRRAAGGPVPAGPEPDPAFASALDVPREAARNSGWNSSSGGGCGGASWGSSGGPAIRSPTAWRSRASQAARR